MGSVGIGKTNPSVALDVIGSISANANVIATGLCFGADCKTSWASVVGGPYLPLSGGTMTGAINAGGQNISNVNELTVTKINATTIDPLYKINNVNYSTFAASIAGGVKEEYVGKIKIEKEIRSGNKNTAREYEAAIDFTKIEEGSDLWVWRKVVDFNPESVDVALTPYGSFAQVYYLISGDKLIFRSDRPAKISYRLIGKRFDWRDWPTKSKNQSEAGYEVN
jgi:hypothetical protein